MSTEAIGRTQETLTVEEFRRAIGQPVKHDDAKLKNKPTSRVPSPLEQRFIDNSGRLPPFEREYRFHSERKWRLDIAWPAVKVAVEIQGGSFVNGGHNRAGQQAKDMAKANEAQILGWVVLSFNTAQMENMDAVIDTVLRALDRAGV